MIAPSASRPVFSGVMPHLAVKAGAPIVPVAHNAGDLWARNAFVKRPGTVTVCFQPEIPARLPREEMEARVHEAINRDPLTAETLP